MTNEAISTILSVPKFRQRFELLSKCIEDDPQKVVPWIGAGMSKPFGLPLWKEFLEDTSRKLLPKEKEIFDQMMALQNSDLSLVAEFLHSRLGRILHEEVINSFNKSIRWDPSKCPIPWLGVQKVITTNYDRILDSSLPWLAPVTAVTAASEYRELRCLIKLHGRVDDPRTVVLTTSQYIRAYTTEFWMWFEQFARDRTFIFLGCSLHSDEFLRVLKSPASGSPPRHYAIIPTRSPEESIRRGQELLETYGIEMISYDPIDHGHGVVRELLTKLRPRLAIERMQIEEITNEAELELAWHIFLKDQNKAERDDKIQYLSLLLSTAHTLTPSPNIRSVIFNELLNYCNDQAAFSTLLQVAAGSRDEINTVLAQQDKLRPAIKIPNVLPQSQVPLIRDYYSAFRLGRHDDACKHLSKIEKRPGLDKARIEVLILQNELYAGRIDQQLILNFSQKITNSERRSQYLHYGLGLFYLWANELERAKSNFRTAQSTWQKGRGGFIFWQLALCAMLERDFATARIQLAKMEDASFPPLGIAASFIEKAGGYELSLEPRRAASEELYAWVWSLRSLVDLASGHESKKGDLENSTYILKRNSQDDLLLSWFLYAVELVGGRNNDPLRIELQHRTQDSLGIKLILKAIGLLLAEISEKIAADFVDAAL